MKIQKMKVQVSLSHSLSHIHTCTHTHTPHFEGGCLNRKTGNFPVLKFSKNIPTGQRSPFSGDNQAPSKF